jgi:hypothetical protein
LVLKTIPHRIWGITDVLHSLPKPVDGSIDQKNEELVFPE